MIYVTLDADGENIAEGANIVAVADLDAARAYLLACYHPTDWDLASADIGAGNYGDCWIKSTSGVDHVDIRPFTLDQLYIAEPGTHPGGRMWWIEPREPVFVVRNINPK